MREPRRWLDAGSGAPAEVRALLEVAAGPAELPLAARARVRLALVDRWTPRYHPATFWSALLGTALAAAALGWTPPASDPSDSQVVSVTGLGADTSVPALPHRAAPAPELHAPAPAVPLAGNSSSGARTRAHDGAEVSRRTASVPSPRPSPTAAQRERWQRQRWANEKRRSRERIAAIVDAVLKPDARLLEEAGQQVDVDPGRALALIEAFRKRYPLAEIPAPSVVVEVDALRRMGRFEEALERARTFVDASRKDYYADEMRQRFAFLEL